MNINILKKVLPTIAFLIVSTVTNSATLLTIDDAGYDGVRINSTGYDERFIDKYEGLNEGETQTKSIGERLHKVTAAQFKEVAKFVIDAPLTLQGEAGFFSTPKTTVPAGVYYSTFRVKHPIHGYLYFLKNIEPVLDAGIFINSDGAVFPQFVRINKFNSNLFGTQKITKIDDAKISVTLENRQNLSFTVDSHLKGIERGVITIAAHCINANGEINGEKEYQFSDSTPSIALPSAKLEIINTSSNSITYKIVNATAIFGCPFPKR